MSRGTRLDKAHEVLEIVGDGGFFDPDGVWWDIDIPESTLYTPEDLDLIEKTGKFFGPTQFYVLDGFTQDAFSHVSSPIHTAVLNFASARSPGGGFLSGSRAQEEELCRCSALYPSLLAQPRYYHANKAHPNTLYTDHVIFSMDVPFFRRSSNHEPGQPEFASVITCPAPNLMGNDDQSADFWLDLEEIWKKRWRAVLLVAEKHGVTTLVLGAWGCGAFRNDPEMVADTFLQVWKELNLDGTFREVIFAIPGSYDANSGVNLEVFKTVLEEEVEIKEITTEKSAEEHPDEPAL